MQSKADTAYSWVKTGFNKAKQYALNLTDIEIKVEEATNNDPWGPHGTAMTEIAKASYDIDNYKQIMGVIARRLQDTEEDWRHVYKSLLLLEFMSKHGPQKVVEELVSNIGVVEKLQNFQYKDAKGKDWGLNVRNRAKELANFVLDSDRVRSERAKAKQNESKYTGTSSNDMKDSGFGSKSSGDSGFGSKSSSFGGIGSGSALSKLPSTKASSRYDDFDLPERSNAATKSDTGGSFADEAVQATRARIEALKKDAPAPDSPGKDSIPAKPPQARPKPGPQPDAKGPKKLSDIKVSANIAASLGNIKLASPASSPAAPASSGGPAKGPAAGATATPAARSHMDLLGGLDAPAPVSSHKAAAPASPGADVWSTFSTSRDSPAAAPDAFGSSDPFGSSFATPAATLAASHAPFGAPSTATAPSSSDPFGSLGGDPFGAPAPNRGGQTLGSSSSRGAQSNTSTASADPFGVPSLSASSDKPTTPTAAAARPLPEDMFAAPAVPTATGFNMGGFGAPQQMQQPGFGHMGGAFGQQVGMGGPPRAPFPGMQPGGGAFGVPHQQQQQSAFGAQQGAFGMPGGFGGQQRGPQQQQSGFGASDPFGSSAGGFGGSSDLFGASSNLFTQGTSPSTAAKTGQASTGGKDPFADLSAFH